MNIPVIAFFNNKGGVGKTSLVYHLAWMYADLGVKVLAADLDPQSNLTATCLDDDELENVLEDETKRKTIYGSVLPLKRGTGDIDKPYIHTVDKISGNFGLLLGDLALSEFEDGLSEVWPKCNDRDERAFRVTTAFWRLLQEAGRQHKADLILADIGPNLGAINRATLIASDYLVVPLAPDLFSLQGLKNLGPTLRRWRKEWRERTEKNPIESFPLPSGEMDPIGYIVIMHSTRLDRPVKAYDRWIARIPKIYREAVLDQKAVGRRAAQMQLSEDKECLLMLKHYRSLAPLAQEARKPMFHLKPADGAIGAHTFVVQSVRVDFESLAKKIAKKANVEIE